MDDNTAAVIFWVALLAFIVGLIGLVVWLMSRRRTTEVIVQYQPTEQWYQQPQHPQIAPPPGYQPPPGSMPPAPPVNPQAPASPPVIDVPPSQPQQPATRRGAYREMLQEKSQDSESGSDGLN